MKAFRPVVHVCLALSLAACAGVDELSVDTSGGTSHQTLTLEFPPARAVEHLLPFRISGGVPPYESSIEDCPDWVTLFRDQGILAGTAPAGDQGRTFFCTYSVTDSAVFDRQSTTFGLKLVVGAAVRLALPSVLDQEFDIGTFRSVPLPAASGGVGPYTYSFTCVGGTLPPGVSFAPATRVLAGTADAVFRDSCTYAVTDSSQPAVTFSQDIEVTSAAARPLALTRPPDQEFDIGTFRSVPLPEASGGVEPYMYTFTCAGGALPSGVGFVPVTRVLAGTADAVFRDSCTYAVTDSSRPAATISHDIEVTSAAAGPLALHPVSDQAFVIGLFRSDTLPAATGGVGPYTYTFACAGGRLPPGVSFAPATRVLAGTADAVFRDSCTYTVTDSSRPAATVSRNLEVTSATDRALALTQVFETAPGNELTLKIGRRSQTIFQLASGGVAPYTYELVDCALPAGLEFHPNTRVLSGTPDAEYRGPNCTYRVTDSSSPSASVSLTFVLVVEPLEAGDWRFRTRTVESGQGLCIIPGGESVGVATLPAAHAGEGDARYALPGAPHPPGSGVFLSFEPSSRVLTYTNPDPPPVLGTPNTFRYLVGTVASVDAANADDALCLDVQYNVPESGTCSDETPSPYIHVRLQVRDDAFWDESAKEYRCPDTTAPEPRPGAQGAPSNPVHEALGPVHARRATAVAHAAVRDRVRGWSPGAEQASFAIAPEVGLASLSGQSEGFDYSGTSESASFSAETGARAWQAGLVVSLTRTELHYRAEAALAERGYRTGEHDTELLSLHPFAAWHAPSGGHLWASLGVGDGELRHRDDLGFRSWSRSDVRLRAWAAGASVPLVRVLSGELDAEAGVESFAFAIEGGDRISAALPTLRGRDYRAGLAWSAPVSGAPTLSLAYRRSTGDGPEGARVEARGSMSAEGILDPRLTLSGSAEAAFGLGDYEQDAWHVGGGVHFAPDALGRGFGLDLGVRLVSPADGRPDGVGARAEAGYGLWSGSRLGLVRPYVGLIRYPGDMFVRRTVGLNLRDTPTTRVNVEVHDPHRDSSPAFELTLHHRF